MRVHIMSVGFTPEVFLSPMKVIAKTGADRAIAIDSKRSVSKKNKEKAKTTVAAIKKLVETKEVFIDDKPFEKAVRECMNILNSTGKNDELYVHISGGERHTSLALFYATFFVKRKMRLVITTRVGEFKAEVLPSFPNPFNLSASQVKVLKSVKQTMKLKDIVTNLKGKRKDYPRIYRHLENLVELGLLSSDQATKTYSRTLLGRLALEAFK